MLKELRKALAESKRPQGEIAAAAGIHRVNLSKFKSGDRELPYAQLARLAAVLGYEPALKRKRK